MFNSRKVRHKYVLAMIDNSKRPAHPLKDDLGQGQTIHYFGLTKREYFAGLAMQGLLSNLADIRKEGFRDNEISMFAIMQADALLKQLEQ